MQSLFGTCNPGDNASLDLREEMENHPGHGYALVLEQGSGDLSVACSDCGHVFFRIGVALV